MKYVDDYTQEQIEELKPQDWMLDAIKRNPVYCGWGVGDDAMCDDISFDTWRSFLHSFTKSLDDLNEIVNFYFSIERHAVDCEICEASGYNPATHELSENFYAFEDRSKQWGDAITQEETDYLWNEGRLWLWKEKPTAEMVNQRQSKSICHDAINRYMLIEFRAKKLEIYGKCSYCGGHGENYTEDSAHLELNLWYIHPRKGRSQGVRIERIEESEMSEVMEFLRKARDRNTERFGKLD